ncbi:[Fe-S]-dependent transcriptional repressor FeoC [Enterobacteriaceae bacterium ESL0689]|nr:[Fe-S]-dependent transcriptional repressor FeoC [Enterobacteriaceae bacterium ESL0689]
MASLIEVCNMLALQGRMQSKQLSASLHTPQPLIDAMLSRLEAMGKVVRLTEDTEGCLSGSCKSCPEGKACLREWWALRQ